MTSSIPFAARLVAAALAALVAPACLAQLKDENLLLTLPPGYKVGHEARNGDILTREMVPEGETVKNWTEMYSTQIFYGMKGTSPETFKAAMRERWLQACKGATSYTVAAGEEQGYPFVVWLLRCPLNTATGKPENTWFKAIAGNDSFYLVQKAFKFEPSEQQVAYWMPILRRVAVCDTRLADRPCPNPR